MTTRPISRENARAWAISAAEHARETGHRPVHGVIHGGGWACPAPFCGMWDSDLSELVRKPHKRHRVRAMLIGGVFGYSASFLFVSGHWPWGLAVLVAFAAVSAYALSETHLYRSSHRAREVRRAKWRARLGRIR